jgi:tryptophan-rich sensory protein
LTTYSLRTHWPLLLLFIAMVMGIGFVVGLISAPGAWFDSLRKPDYIVPAWFSAPVWFLLCIAFAVAGWRLWLRDSSSTETRLWLAILILSWWYSPVFFVARTPMIALAIIALLTLLMIVFVARAWSLDRVSAWLFVPCTAWVAYAAVVTAAITGMNP